jgi:O-antigen/teichoic acid export membrane protein
MGSTRTLMPPVGRGRTAMGAFTSVAGGSAVGQLALAASLPFVARLYSPSSVGIFAVMLAYSQVASIVVTGRLEVALPRLSVGRRWVAARLVLVVGGVLTPVAGWAVYALAGRSDVHEAVLAGVLVASLFLYNTGSFALLAEERYSTVASLRIVNGVVTGAAQIVGGILLPEVWVLLLTYALGNIAAILLALPSLVRLHRSRDATAASVVLREERLGRFAASVGSGAVLSNLGLALPLVGVSLLFGEAAAGSFWLARRVLMVPTQLVATSVSEVSYAMVARESIERISQLVTAWLRRSRLPALVLTVTGLVAAPVVPLVVGAGYVDIAWVVALLTLPAVAQMVATSFSNILLALRMEVTRTVWNVGRLLGLLVVFAWAERVDAGFLEAVAVFAVFTALAYAVLLALTMRGLRRRREAA